MLGRKQESPSAEVGKHRLSSELIPSTAQGSPALPCCHSTRRIAAAWLCSRARRALCCWARQAQSYSDIAQGAKLSKHQQIRGEE